ELLEPAGGELWNGWPNRGEGIVSWNAADPDSQALTYTIEKSTDGAAWTVLVADTTTAARTWSWGTWAEEDGRYRLRVTGETRTA
ncbi:MAG: hypothetical protein ACE5G2_05255, partial [Candidatus Krumholzibacteriia bacterium]